MVHLPGKSSALGKSFGQELYLSLRSLVQILGGALVELISLAQEKRLEIFRVPSLGHHQGSPQVVQLPCFLSEASVFETS